MKAQIIQQPDVEEIPVEILAQHIERISTAMSEFTRGRVKKRAVIVLLHDITKLPMGDIGRVLDAIEVLASVYIKPKAK